MGTKGRREARARDVVPDDAPADTTVIRGGGQVGPLFATWPFASLWISRNELRIRWPFGSETVTRRDGGRVVLDERLRGTCIRLADDRHRGSIRFTSLHTSAVSEALGAYGWTTEHPTP